MGNLTAIATSPTWPKFTGKMSDSRRRAWPSSQTSTTLLGS